MPGWTGSVWPIDSCSCHLAARPAPLLHLPAPPRLPLQVRPRRIGKWFFYERAPTITAKQSHVIVKAMQKLGFLDKDGWLKDDPRIGNVVSGGGTGGGGDAGTVESRPPRSLPCPRLQYMYHTICICDP